MDRVLSTRRKQYSLMAWPLLVSIEGCLWYMKVVIYGMGSSVTLLLGMLFVFVFVLGQQIHVVKYNLSAGIRGCRKKIVRNEKFSDCLTSVNFVVVCINFGGDIWKPWLQEC